jgi:hypothetical protein
MRTQSGQTDPNLPPDDYLNHGIEYGLINRSVSVGRDGFVMETWVYGFGNNNVDLGAIDPEVKYVVYAGAGDDNIQGGNRNDDFYGEAGEDYLYGGAGNDRLYGGTGDDILSGSLGDDRLWGGEGADTFSFSPRHGAISTGVDTIEDFEPGVDQIGFYGGFHGLFWYPPGSETNYAEFTANAGTSIDTIKAAAAWTLAGNAVKYVFVADGTDGYLFADGGDNPDVMIVLKGIGSVDQFSWDMIV